MPKDAYISPPCTPNFSDDGSGDGGGGFISRLRTGGGFLFLIKVSSEGERGIEGREEDKNGARGNDISAHFFSLIPCPVLYSP